MKATKGQQTARRVCVAQVVNNSAGDSDISAIPSVHTFEELVGMRIHKVRYFVRSLLEALDTSLDYVKFGLSFISQMPAAGFMPYSPGLIDYQEISRLDVGVAASGLIYKDSSIVQDLTALPGGGLLVHPASVYQWYYTGANLAAVAMAIYRELTFTSEPITQDVWDDLWKAVLGTQI